MSTRDDSNSKKIQRKGSSVENGMCVDGEQTTLFQLKSFEIGIFSTMSFDNRKLGGGPRFLPHE